MRVSCKIQPPTRKGAASKLQKFKVGEKYKAEEIIVTNEAGRRIMTYVLYLPSINDHFNIEGRYAPACEISQRTFKRYFIKQSWG